MNDTSAPDDSALMTESSPPQASEVAPAPGQWSEAQLAEALEGDRYSFCTKDRSLAWQEWQSCSFAEAAEQRCPAFKRVCTTDDRRFEMKVDESNGAGFGALGVALSWGLLAGALLLLLVYLIRAFLRLGVTAVGAAEPAQPRSETLIEVADPTPNPDADALLARAEELARERQYARALPELYAAVLLRLRNRGALTLERGRTAGDYARQLRPQRELWRYFLTFVLDFESVQFGNRVANEEVWQRARQNAQPLLAVLLLVLGLGAATGCQEPGDSNTRRSNECGVRAHEYGLLCDLFGEHRVTRRIARLDANSPSVAMRILLPGFAAEEQANALLEWTSAGHTLVVTAPVDAIDAALGVSRGRDWCAGRATVETDGLSGVSAKKLAGEGYTFEGSTLEPYAHCEGHVFVGGLEWDDGYVIYLPSASLLSNASLVAGDNAALLAPLFPIEGDIELLGPWTRVTGDTPFAALAAAKLWSWFFHAALFLAALALCLGSPFGRRLAVSENQRRSFSDHARAIGERWAETKAASSALKAYAEWALERLNERHPTTRGNIAALASALNRRFGLDEAYLNRTLTAAAQAAARSESTRDETDALNTMRQIQRIVDLRGKK